MLCGLDKSAQKSVVLQRKSTYLLCSYKDKLQNACPADIKALRRKIQEDLKPKYEEIKPKDADFKEYEGDLEIHPSELAIEPPKVKIWDEYRKLLELSKLEPKPKASFKHPLMHVTSLPKIHHLVSRPYLKKSIMRSEVQKKILVANTNYVQFRNFELKKVYKKTVTLQNISNMPARFQIRRRPYCSKFRVIVKPIVEDRGIIPPGMQLRLIILFRCDDIDAPEELLVLNVQHGKQLIIRLHGYKEPPILLGTCLIEESSYRYLNRHDKLLNQTWHPEIATSLDNLESITSSSSESLSSWMKEDDDFVSMTFDCKKVFIGEEAYVQIKFKNTGGKGRFFMMSETDWFSMNITNVTEKNILKLSCFIVYPAYFELDTNEEMDFHMYFSPESYGIHVEKLYILCDNCTLLETEIIGDGLIYEPNFVQLSKHLKKLRPFAKHIDERADYYVKLNSNAPDGIGQCIIAVSNTSEISMHFSWMKRNVQANVDRIQKEYYFPLKLLHITPDEGIFAPTSIHYFTVTAEYKDLKPNYYFAVLQLYVEDIPVDAIAKNSGLETRECTRKRRKCPASVDIWIADVEVSLQYMMEEESRTDRTTEEILERILEIPPPFQYPQLSEDEDEEEEVAEALEVKEEQRSTCQLVADELFYHHDLVNLRQFELLWKEQVISIGVIRPTRTLYIGVEETYILILKNLANDLVNYSWGKTNGLDSSKMKLCVCPMKGEVTAGNSEKIEITITPITEGIVQSLFIPCFVGDSRRMLMLGIECSIEPLYVTFYFPLNDDTPLKFKNNFVKVKWRVDSLKLALDMAGRSKKYMKLLNKYKKREERELMNTNLDQGDVLRDASAGPSIQKMMVEESGEQSFSNTCTSEINQMSNVMGSNNCLQDMVSSGSIVPIYEKFLPLVTQPVVIEFPNLPLRKVQKKTFIIKNETSIPTDFWLRIKNFYPITCSCEWKSQEDQIKFIYKRIFSRQKGLIEDILHKVKQPGSGIVIYVDPLNSNIGPFKAVSVDIYIFADTWGIYVDELEINVTGLPQYAIGICVQVVGSPISLSISDRNEFNVPVIRYGMISTGIHLQERKILLTNTSVVPIIIDWHTFIVKPVLESMPFNVAFNFRTPFTDELASKLRTNQQKADSEIHLEEHFLSSRSIHACDSIEFDSSAISNITSSYMESSYMTTSWMRNSETSNQYTTRNFNKCSKNDHKYIQNKIYPHTSNIEEKRYIELQISILPYYGLIDSRICTVIPREMFIPPKGNASLIIDIQLEKYKTMMNKSIEGEFVCKILGFIRIAPTDMYKDNYYARQSGNYFPPIEIDVTANITKPHLDFHISKFDKIFVCCASKVMQTRRKKLELTKTLFLYNTNNKSIEITLETYKPFHIKSKSGTELHNFGIICISPNGCTEVEIACVVEEKLIQTIMNTNSNRDFNDAKIIVKELLYIVHSDKHYQNVELILEIHLPILKLSSYTLDFGVVYIGDTKKLTLTIKNLSICRLNCKINKKTNVEEFMVDKEHGILPSHYNHKGWYFTVTISFQPKKLGQLVETLEILTGVPYSTEECQLYGEGTLDEKYHTPGV
ncbi:hypothetical protein QLX08_002727 [Tetragonisca angustula]